MASGSEQTEFKTVINRVGSLVVGGVGTLRLKTVTGKLVEWSPVTVLALLPAYNLGSLCVKMRCTTSFLYLSRVNLNACIIQFYPRLPYGPPVTGLVVNNVSSGESEKGDTLDLWVRFADYYTTAVTTGGYSV